MRKIEPSPDNLRQGANNGIRNSYPNNLPRDDSYGPTNMERAFAQEINGQDYPRNER